MKWSKHIVIKRIFKGLFALLVVYLLFIIVPILSFEEYINRNPMAPLWVKGAYHVHSTFSDGTGSLETISRAAASADLDFLILTDHGNPNRKSVMATGWRNNVLIVGASELSLREGHLAAIGCSLKDYRFPPDASSAIKEIREEGGVSIIAHPLDRRIPWTNWNIPPSDGMEILSLYSSATGRGPALLLTFPARYLFSRNYALLRILKDPRPNIEIWDRIHRSGGRCSGFFSLDAHAKLQISDRLHLAYPSYEALFQSLAIYVRLPRPLHRDPEISADHMTQSLKSGHFFNVIEGLAPANGFQFHYVIPGGRPFLPGDSTIHVPGGRLDLKLPFQFRTDIHIIRNGEIVQSITQNRRHHLSIPIPSPGVYRLEVTIPDSSFPHLPWILTNPIYLRPDIALPPSTDTTRDAPSGQIPFSNHTEAGSFQMECSPSSHGTLSFPGKEWSRSPSLTVRYHLTASPGEKNYWVAAACRSAMDLSSYRGIRFRTRSRPSMRYWVEIRTGEREKEECWYSFSFLSRDQWEERSLHFKDFFQVHGPQAPLDTEKISSFFFSVNHSSTDLPSLSGELEIEALNLIRSWPGALEVESLRWE